VTILAPPLENIFGDQPIKVNINGGGLMTARTKMVEMILYTFMDS